VEGVWLKEKEEMIASSRDPDCISRRERAKKERGGDDDTEGGDKPAADGHERSGR